MTHNERLEFCKVCVNRKFNPQQGIICKLTDAPAQFEDTCPDFVRDETVAETSPEEKALQGLDIEKLKEEEQFLPAVAVGLIVGLVGAIIWGYISVASGYQIGYLALAVGAGVGLGVRFVGKGISQKFGIAGAIIAGLSVVLGNLFAIAGIFGEMMGEGFFSSLTSFDYAVGFQVWTEEFGMYDILFLGIAIYEGYKFAFRTFEVKK